MSRLSYAPIAVKSNENTYYGFRGIDRSHDITAMETKENQHFWNLENCSVDYRGQLSRDPASYLYVEASRFPITALRFWSRENLVFAEEDSARVNLVSDTGIRLDSAYDKGAVVHMTNFKGRVRIFSPDQAIKDFNGTNFGTSTASAKPSFGVAIQRRLAIAGFKDEPNVIKFSRVDEPNIFTDEESDTSTAKAFFIDISDLIGTADVITGLGTFEANRLAVFTNDQTLVYILDPDYTQWSLDSRANLRIGCIAHGTIANAGSDLLFCSRRGIHSIMRSEQNGVTIAEASLSEEIEPLYQDLVRTTPDQSAIKAVYDSDTQTYHVFFPRKGNQLTKRLSMNFRQGYEAVNFQLGDTLFPRCGDFLGGRLMMGTSDGVYETLDRSFSIETGTADLRRSQMVAETPVLWLGDFMATKRCHTFIIQASGKGRFFVDAFDENGTDMASLEVNLDRLEGDKLWGDQPLKADYTFPFNHVFRGVMLRFRTEETDQESNITIISFAFLTHKDK